MCDDLYNSGQHLEIEKNNGRRYWVRGGRARLFYDMGSCRLAGSRKAAVVGGGAVGNTLRFSRCRSRGHRRRQNRQAATVVAIAAIVAVDVDIVEIAKPQQSSPT